ncbi:MAG: hypothetical protein JXB49_12195 [Bacteroidales bacterium]|nr:hypothetical protein [Bacteroidales bacterium]
MNVQKINYFFSLLFVLLMVCIYYAITPDSSYIQNMFSADVMYLPAMYKDIFYDGYKLTDWNFPGAPFFFPDMGLYFLLNFIFRSFSVTLFVYAIVQFLILILLSHKLIQTIESKTNYNQLAISSLLYCFFIFITVQSKQISSFSYYLLTPIYHTGVFICSLLALIFTINYYYRKRSNLILYILPIMIIVSILSDRLFLIVFSIPFLLSLVIQKSKWKENRFKVLFLLTVLSTAVGYGMLFFLGKVFTIYNPKIELDLDIFKSLIPQIIQFFEHYLKPLNLVSLIVTLGIISYLITVVIVILNRSLTERHRMFHLYFIFLFPIALITPFVTKLYNSITCIRYIIFIFYFAIINLVLLLNYYKKLINGKYFKYGLSVILGLSILLLTIMYSPQKIINGISGFIHFKPDYIECFDNVSDELGLKYGISDYWYSKVIIMFSKKGKRVYTVYNSSLNPYTHVSNSNWYYQLDYGKFNRPVYNFIIMGKNYKNSELNEIFGEIDTSIMCNDMLIIKTPEFYFSDDKKIILKE